MGGDDVAEMCRRRRRDDGVRVRARIHGGCVGADFAKDCRRRRGGHRVRVRQGDGILIRARMHSGCVGEGVVSVRVSDPEDDVTIGWETGWFCTSCHQLGAPRRPGSPLTRNIKSRIRPKCLAAKVSAPSHTSDPPRPDLPYPGHRHLDPPIDIGNQDDGGW